MKKLLFFVVAACLLFAGCKDNEPGDNPDPEIPLEPVEVVMQNSVVSVIVRDTDGNNLEGVVITTGTESATTNFAGLFSFDQVGTVSNRSVIRFSKDGYFTVTRSGVKQDEMGMEVVMHPKGNTPGVSMRTTFSAATAKTLIVGGMKVDIPAASLVKDDGSTYAGSVNADVLYLDPNNEDFPVMMPGGDLAALRTDNSDAILLSWGMVEVSLTDDSGKPLQLKKDGTSEMTYPIPAGMESNPPATIPLWYFDEERGLWREEGVATLKGNVYVGTVKHFSWHNLDEPKKRVTIKGTVTDTDGNFVAGVKVTVDQTSAITGMDGSYSVVVPENTPVTVSVLCKDYLDYCDYNKMVAIPVPGKPGGTTVTQDIELPYFPFVRGKIITTADQAVTACVCIEYYDKGNLVKTKYVVTGSGGTFELRIPPVKGPGKVIIKTVDGKDEEKEITLTGKDVQVGALVMGDITEAGTLTVTPQGMAPIAVSIKREESFVQFKDNGFAFVSGKAGIAIANFDRLVSQYTGAEITVMGSGFIFGTENGEMKINGKVGHIYSLTVSGNGEYTYHNGTKNVTIPATVSGTVEAGVNVATYTTKNITKWSDLLLPATIPVLLTPIDQAGYVETYMGSGSDTYSMVLYYKNRARPDYNDVKSKIAVAGYHIQWEENTSGTTTKVTYAKGGDSIAVWYSDDGVPGFEQVNGEDARLVIQIFYK